MPRDAELPDRLPADLGRAQKAAAVNRALLRRAWAMGAAPDPGVSTIGPDATWISTYGPGEEGSAFSYKHEVGMSPTGRCWACAARPATCWRRGLGAATRMRAGR